VAAPAQRLDAASQPTPAPKSDFKPSSPLKRMAGTLLGYGTVGATLAMLFFFLVLPVGLIVVKAFYHDGSLTLDYFRLLFANDLQTDAIVNSLLIGLATTVVATAVSLPLAVINAKYEFPLKGLLTGLLLVPMVMPPFVGAIGVQRFFARRGSVNLLLMDLGWIDSPIEWLGGSNLFWAVVVLEVLHLYPIMYLNLSAALANIDPSLEEMASTLGVPRWRQYKDIIWPLARPGYFAGAIIVFIWALTDLGTPLLVGFHATMPVRIFNLVTDVNENPVGFALVFLVIVLTVLIFLARTTTPSSITRRSSRPSCRSSASRTASTSLSSRRGSTSSWGCSSPTSSSASSSRSPACSTAW
jgi:iron(III) transport system permease protein